MKRNVKKKAGTITPELFRSMLQSVDTFAEKYRLQMLEEKESAALRDYWWCYLIQTICNLEKIFKNKTPPADMLMDLMHAAWVLTQIFESRKMPLADTLKKTKVKRKSKDEYQSPEPKKRYKHSVKVKKVKKKANG